MASENSNSIKIPKNSEIENTFFLPFFIPKTKNLPDFFDTNAGNLNYQIYLSMLKKDLKKVLSLDLVKLCALVLNKTNFIEKSKDNFLKRNFYKKQQKMDKIIFKIKNNKSFQKYVDTILSLSHRPYRGTPWFCKKENLNSGTIKPLKSIYKTTLLIIHKLSTNTKNKRESSEMNKQFFDMPKILDICAVYGPNNKGIVSEVIINIFESDERFSSDLDDALISASIVLKEYYEDKKGVVFSLVADIFFCINELLSAYPPSSELIKNSIFFEQIFMMIQYLKKIKEKKKKENKTNIKELELTEKCIGEILYKVCDFCYVKQILHQSKNETEIERKKVVGEFIKFLKSINNIKEVKEFVLDSKSKFKFTDLYKNLEMNESCLSDEDLSTISNFFEISKSVPLEAKNISKVLSIFPVLSLDAAKSILNRFEGDLESAVYFILERGMGQIQEVEESEKQKEIKCKKDTKKCFNIYEDEWLEENLEGPLNIDKDKTLDETFN